MCSPNIYLLTKPQCRHLYILRYLNTPRRHLSVATRETDKALIKNSNSKEIALPDWLVDNEQSSNLSLNILKDNSLYITKEESLRFIVPKPKSDNYPVVDWVYNNIAKSIKFQHVAITLNVLSISQIENQSLLDSLNIDGGFNMKLYFYVIHLWIIHRRLIKIKPYGHILTSEMFTIGWDMIARWIVEKQGKRSLAREMDNIKRIVQVFCMELNIATQCEDLIPLRIGQTLYKFMYIDSEFNKAGMINCIKYTMRQFLHLQNLDEEEVMEARFNWASYDCIYKSPKVFGLATPSLLKRESDTKRAISP